MLVRAAVVLLIALNLGVALWWALRPPPSPPAPPQQSAGVPRLQLLAEASAQARETAALAAGLSPGDTAPLTEAAEEGAPTAAVADPAQRPARADADADADAAAGDTCHRFGPFADDGALERARAALQPQVRRLRDREVSGTPSGWRVLMPPQGDRAAAQETIARLTAAGFHDHFILGGDEANAIALGRFRSADAARRHTAALQAAGFAARAEPVGAPTRRWLDVAAAAGFDAAAARRAAGDAPMQPLDCAELR